MNTLKENMAIGLLVALAIGPSLTPNPNLSVAVRLSSISLLATATGGRALRELTSPQSRFKERVTRIEDNAQGFEEAHRVT